MHPEAEISVLRSQAAVVLRNLIVLERKEITEEFPSVAVQWPDYPAKAGVEI